MEQALEISNIKYANHMHLQCVHTCTVMYRAALSIYQWIWSVKTTVYNQTQYCLCEW